MSIVKLDAKIKIKRSTTTGEVPTIGPSGDHTDGTWSATDIYEGELFLNTVDRKLWVGVGSEVIEIELALVDYLALSGGVMTGLIQQPVYDSADDLPDATSYIGAYAMYVDPAVRDEPLAIYCDGVDWRHCSDDSVV